MERKPFADPRNRLAGIRTELANERTLLAYARTALGFALAGASSLHFLERPEGYVLGGILLAAGIACASAGAKRFLEVRRRLSRIPLDPGPGEDG